MQATPLKKVISLFLLFLIVNLIIGCKNYKKEKMQGYVDATLVYASSLRAGKLMARDLQKGDKIEIGDILFKLGEEPEKSALEIGQEKVRESKAHLIDLEKGQRLSEIQALEAKITQAQATADLAQLKWQRQADLYEKKFTSKDNLDVAKKEIDASLALQEELKANLKTAKLGSREDQITTAKAQLEQAIADIERLEWEYGLKVVKALVHGTVFDYYYEPGENVPANKPVLSILVPEKIKAIFYVSEEELSQLKIGEKVKIYCDGCKKDIVATISFISPIAEYTPPVIYSVQRRAELVFRVEAKFKPEEASTMRLGLPIEAVLLK